REETVKALQKRLQIDKCLLVEVAELETAAQELVAQQSGCVQKGFDIAFAVLEQLLVRDDLRHLETESKAGWCLVAPAFHHLRAGRAIERAIHFDDGIVPGVVGQVCSRGQSFWIKHAPPFLV